MVLLCDALISLLLVHISQKELTMFSDMPSWVYDSVASGEMPIKFGDRAVDVYSYFLQNGPSVFQRS